MKQFSFVVFSFFAAFFLPSFAFANTTVSGTITTNTPWLDKVHYLNQFTDGIFISSVHSKSLTYLATSTQYKSALWGAIGIWNAQGQVVISTSTVASTSGNGDKYNIISKSMS